MNAAATRRLAGLNAHLSPTPSAGVLKWLSNLFGGGSEEEEDHGHGHGHGDDDHSHGHGHGDDDASDHEGSEPPAVRGVVKLCFKADEDWPGAEVQADPRHEGHYYRQRVETISVEHDEDMMSIPPSHRMVDFKDPNDRALMMTTSEGYEKLRAALPHAAATLAAEVIPTPSHLLDRISG